MCQSVALAHPSVQYTFLLLNICLFLYKLSVYLGSSKQKKRKTLFSGGEVTLAFFTEHFN